MHSRSHTWSPGAPFLRVNCRELPLTAVFLCQFLPCLLGPPCPPLAFNLYITCCSDCTTRTLHMLKPVKPSLSKWGRGPQAEALPVVRLTLPWPHPLAWYCRSVWSWPYELTYTLSLSCHTYCHRVTIHIVTEVPYTLLVNQFYQF